MYYQVATVISAEANWNIAGIRSIGWGWAGVIWLFNTVTYIFLDPLKFAVRYGLSGRAWNLVVNQRVSTMNTLHFECIHIYIQYNEYDLFLVQFNRLHLPTKMTLVKKLVRQLGLLSREPCMVFILLLNQKHLQRNTATEN